MQKSAQMTLHAHVMYALHVYDMRHAVCWSAMSACENELMAVVT